jgi:hypothetical protein
MTTRTLHEGLRFLEVGIPYHERSGRSKLSVVRDGSRFLVTILWTALQYNPARFLEAAGVAAIALAALIWAVLVAARLYGVAQLDAVGVFLVYLSLILGVGGVSMACLGTAFNRLVALFHGHPIHQKSFISDPSGATPERRFGWTGVVLTVLGSGLSVVSLALGLGGWEMARLWFWLVGSALVLLVGVHLLLFWGLLRILYTLEDRPSRVGSEMGGLAESLESLGRAKVV